MLERCRQEESDGSNREEGEHMSHFARARRPTTKPDGPLIRSVPVQTKIHLPMTYGWWPVYACAYWSEPCGTYTCRNSYDCKIFTSVVPDSVTEYMYRYMALRRRTTTTTTTTVRTVSSSLFRPSWKPVRVVGPRNVY